MLGVLFSVWVAAVVCWAGDAAGEAKDNDALLARIGVLEAELKALRDGEGAPDAYLKMRELQDAINEKYAAHQKAIQGPQKQAYDLAQQDDVREWNQKISEKQSEIWRLRREWQNETQKRGRELHARRVAELSALAVTDATAGRALGFEPLTYPRVDGSTSARPLGVIVACKLLGAPHRWAGVKPYSGRWGVADDDGVDGEMFMPFGSYPMPAGGYVGYRHRRGQMTLIEFHPLAVEPEPFSLAESRRATVINRMLTVHAGTHGAYVNVIEGNADIALLARTPSDEELTVAREKGVALEVVPFARDAFVFIVNYKNTVVGLTSAQIRAIYTGEVTNWKEVGGADERISAYQRDQNSGSQELMKGLFMKGTPMTVLAGHAPRLIAQGMGGPYIALTGNEHGIGYSVYYYEHFMAASPNTKLLAVDGVSPSYESIASRAYPYTSDVYVVTPAGLDEGSAALRLRQWLLSAEGQAVVRESGYVPLYPGGR
jgi:ABC-type phosphate transport system substrate-binding protein